jgi:hypothetical protein
MHNECLHVLGKEPVQCALQLLTSMNKHTMGAVGAVVAVQRVSDQWPDADGPRCPLVVSPLGSSQQGLCHDRSASLDTCARAMQHRSSIAAGQRKTPPGRVMQVRIDGPS